jgi:MoaA/NifB/PqqE/SkfB family radical SAM enzyme
MAPRFASVLVSITERCHVGCAHCGFIGSTRDREPDVDEMTDWVEQLCAYGVPMVIFTGGEPFERFDCLVRGVAAARNAGTPAALFTSSVWASSFDVACEKLKQLSGLTHLYLSSDTFHQRRVPYQNVFNVIDAAKVLSIPDVTICITYTNLEELKEVRDRYAHYGEQLKFKEGRVIPNPKFGKKVLKHQGDLRAPNPEEYRFNCWIGTPIVNPNGDVFSCHVGKAAAHRDLKELPYYLGNFYEETFAAMMEQAGARADYQFLRTYGPRAAATLYASEPGLVDAVGCRNGFTTDCDMCFSTLKTQEGRMALNRHVARSEVRDEINLRLSLIFGEEPLL